MTNNRIHTLIRAVAFCLIAALALPAAAQERRKLSRTERKADRNFVRQKFDKAMAGYEAVIEKADNEADKAAIRLKAARLYFMLRNYTGAAGHFGATVEEKPGIMTVADVCDYVDALRFTGEDKKAEAICLNNAYKDIYSRHQRYQNTRDALAMRHTLTADPGYDVTGLSLNTPQAEFWVGSYDRQLFYAMSGSAFNDPGKLFNHRSHYYRLDEEEENAPSGGTGKPPRPSDWFRGIPVDMQNGPVSFSEDMRAMIATVVEYEKKKTSVDIVDPNLRPFRTKLYYSVLRDGKKRFTRYRPVFPPESAFSHAHPFLTNNGKTLLFTSDMPGGYGGFDLYVCHFDEDSAAWGTPANLGAQVNTEGDEISPVLSDGRLIFASNGLPGFGGYDLFSIAFEGDRVLPEAPAHFPYPVNSVFNDYYMCPAGQRSAYFVSDRHPGTRDDIYHLRAAEDITAKGSRPYFGLTEENAIQGGQPLLGGTVEGNRSTRRVELKNLLPEGLILTLYFNFDSSALTPESVSRLEHFMESLERFTPGELLINGYADEMGSDSYNNALSVRRANGVAAFLRAGGVEACFTVAGLGRLKLSPEELAEEIRASGMPEDGIDWIRANRKARRVDICNRRIK